MCRQGNIAYLQSTYLLEYYDILEGISTITIYPQAHYIDFNFMQIKLSNFEGVTTLQHRRIYDANHCVHVYMYENLLGYDAFVIDHVHEHRNHRCCGI